MWNSHSRRWTLACALLALLMVGAWRLLQTPGDIEQAHKEALQQVESSRSAEDESDASRRNSGTSSGALDSSGPARPAFTEDTTVLEMFDRIGDRARAGEPWAACELAAALGACRFERTTRNMIRPAPPPNASEAELEAFVEFHAGFLERRARDARRCAGVGPEALSEMVQFMAHAALAGHVDSLTRFMFAPERHAAEFLANPQLAEMYRTRLWPALRRALEARNVHVAHAMLSQLSHPLPSSLSVIVPETYRDPEVAAALLSLGVQDEEEERKRLASGRDPPSPAAIEAAQRWVDELFGGKLPDLSEASRTRRRGTQSHGGSDCDSPSAWLQRWEAER